MVEKENFGSHRAIVKSVQSERVIALHQPAGSSARTKQLVQTSKLARLHRFCQDFKTLVAFMVIR